jgi:threonine/homoserine/homoserine lactone efflux protein
MNELLIFLASATVISLSGVMAPGAMTAATLAAGTKHRHAGVALALGHGVVEMPLVLAIVFGLGSVITLTSVKIGIGLAGGAFLLLLAWGLLRDARKGPATGDDTSVNATRSPFITGIVLSASNPLFLLWWATVGLKLATDAVDLGIVAFVLFAIIHWLLDLLWLEVLSQGAWRGTQVFSHRAQQIVLGVCGAALGVFGIKFLIDAGIGLHGLMQ